MDLYIGWQTQMNQDWGLVMFEGLTSNPEGCDDHVGMSPIFISGRSYRKRAANRRCMRLRNEEILHEGGGRLVG